jgi:hypothetical protein
MHIKRGIAPATTTVHHQVLGPRDVEDALATETKLCPICTGYVANLLLMIEDGKFRMPGD